MFLRQTTLVYKLIAHFTLRSELKIVTFANIMIVIFNPSVSTDWY